MKDNHSPLADIGYYLQDIEGCVITAQAIEYALGKYAFTRTDKRLFKTLKNPFGFARDVFRRLLKK